MLRQQRRAPGNYSARYASLLGLGRSLAVLAGTGWCSSLRARFLLFAFSLLACSVCRLLPAAALASAAAAQAAENSQGDLQCQQRQLEEYVHDEDKIDEKQENVSRCLRNNARVLRHQSLELSHSGSRDAAHRLVSLRGKVVGNCLGMRDAGLRHLDLFRDNLFLQASLFKTHLQLLLAHCCNISNGRLHLSLHIVLRQQWLHQACPRIGVDVVHQLRSSVEDVGCHDWFPQGLRFSSRLLLTLSQGCHHEHQQHHKDCEPAHGHGPVRPPLCSSSAQAVPGSTGQK
mmetsp:Transcript_78702/g.148497  ORF Transcript_78702/g.148497 Transcript_78702/m.148497 type:complete len:287 (+) Transcript_78702:80-940(+)